MTTFSMPGMIGWKGHTWHANGYEGCGNVTDFIDSLRGRTAIVCGGAKGVFEELDKARDQIPNAVLFAANEVGMFLPELDHWVSLHGDVFPAWRATRRIYPWNKVENVKYHSVRASASVDYVWELLTPLMALSGSFAVQIAHVGGAERIILCGCPGDTTRRFFESPRAHPEFNYGAGDGLKESSLRKQTTDEMSRLPELKAKIRSMGGWSRDYFGGL